MKIGRRQLIVGAAALATSSKFSFAATDLKFTSELIYQNLEKAVWLSTNSEADRVVYVLAAPWCPYCRRLYLAQAEVQHEFDFRFVFMGFRNYGDAVTNAFFSSQNDQVGVFYSNPDASNNVLSPASTDFIDHVNTVTVHIMAKDIGTLISGTGGSSSGAAFAYPTLVFYDGNKQLNALLGGWEYIEQLSSSLPDIPRREGVLPSYPRLIRAVPERKSLNRNYFAKKKGTYLMSAPMDDAPLVDVMAEGSGYNFEYQAMVNAEEWIGTAPFNGFNGLMWGRKAQFFTQ